MSADIDRENDPTADLWGDATTRDSRLANDPLEAPTMAAGRVDLEANPFAQNDLTEEDQDAFAAIAEEAARRAGVGPSVAALADQLIAENRPKRAQARPSSPPAPVVGTPVAPATPSFRPSARPSSFRPIVEKSPPRPVTTDTPVAPPPPSVAEPHPSLLSKFELLASTLEPHLLKIIPIVTAIFLVMGAGVIYWRAKVFESTPSSAAVPREPTLQTTPPGATVFDAKTREILGFTPLMLRPDLEGRSVILELPAHEPTPVTLRASESTVVTLPDAK